MDVERRKRRAAVYEFLAMMSLTLAIALVLAIIAKWG
jgi:hypothetical protein